jgi:RND family efflux transporter MFP subunit
MRRAVVIVMIAACGKSTDPTSAKGGGRSGGSGGGKLQYPVEVLKLETKQVQYTVDAPGTVDAFQQVQITARVSGAVDKVNFAEGQVVKKDDVLAIIETERYQIAVEQSKATLTKAQTTQRAAEAALKRREDADAQSKGLVPGEEIEQKRAAVETAKADVDAAREQLHVAQLNLRDSSVRTPIEGTVQTRTVQQGQFLQPGAVLATILQKDPMLVRFQVNETDAPRLKAGMVANVHLRESKNEFTAKITLVSDAADPTTRQVPVTAQVDDTTHKYWLRPGAFCLVSVPIDAARAAIIVPSLAVAPTEKGNVVYVVDDKDIAHAKVVEIGMHTSDGGVELTRGVNAGDLMVVHGIEPLSEGAPVKISDGTDHAGSGAGSGSGGHARKGSGE